MPNRLIGKDKAGPPSGGKTAGTDRPRANRPYPPGLPGGALDSKMKLTTLKSRIPRLTDQRAGNMPKAPNQRPAGRSWQATRLRIQVRDHSLCADCGRLWRENRDHVDHEVPRWQGGSDDDSNLKLRCLECHDIKTKREAAERARGG